MPEFSITHSHAHTLISDDVLLLSPTSPNPSVHAATSNNQDDVVTSIDVHKNTVHHLFLLDKRVLHSPIYSAGHTKYLTSSFGSVGVFTLSGH